MTTQVNLGKIWAITGGVTDPGDAKYALGWESEIPTFQNFNFVLQNFDKNLLRIAEKGTFNWQDNIAYELGASVWDGDFKYHCRVANTNQQPSLDTLNNYWVKGEFWGSFHAYQNAGNVVNYINNRLGTNLWTGHDQTLYNYNNSLTMYGAKYFSNLLVGNSKGELVVVNTGANDNPDNRELSPTDTGVDRIYHEGYPPVQAEVSGTIPANPNDGKLYGRKDGNWVQVTTVDVSEFPPQPVLGNGAGWYNLTDGNFYLDIDDGDSSQWVPASPVPNLGDYYPKSGGLVSGKVISAYTPFSGLAEMQLANMNPLEGSSYQVTDELGNSMFEFSWDRADSDRCKIVRRDINGLILSEVHFLADGSIETEAPVNISNKLTANVVASGNGLTGTFFSSELTITVVDGIVTAITEGY